MQSRMALSQTEYAESTPKPYWIMAVAKTKTQLSR